MRRAMLLTVFLAASVASAADRPTRLTGAIVDSASGRPVAARLYIQSDKGTFHFAHSTDLKGSAVRYRKQRGPRSVEVHTTLSAHGFAADLPPGRYTLSAERGKEYLPSSTTVVLKGEPVQVSLKLKRWIDMASRGWYSGDTHVHRSLAELPNVVLAEDLNVALPLTHWVTRSHTPPSRGDKNTDATAAAKLIAVDRTHVIWSLNTEYEIFTVKGKRHTLGAVFVLNHQKPLTMGAPPVGPIAIAARKQGAILDLDKHSWPWSLMLIPVMNVDLYELSNNHVWRTEFYFSRWTEEMQPRFMQVESDEKGMTERGWVDFGCGVYYALLNCGFRLRPTAGTASGVHPVPLGFGRVYVHLPEGFSYENWMRGLNAGRSFVTTGPMLMATFNGNPPGTTFGVKDATNVACRIAGSAESAQPLDRIEVVVNGRVAETIRPANRRTDAGGYVSPLKATIKLDGSAWLAVRCFEKRPAGRFRFAHTAPVHFDVPGRPLRPRRAEVRYFIRRMEEELARNAKVFSSAELAEYRKALAAYRKIAERAE